MPCNKSERPATKKHEDERPATTSNALIWIQMTTDAPGDMIRMQNSNQAKRCSPFPVGAAIFIPERRIPGRTLLSFACGITAAPRRCSIPLAAQLPVSRCKILVVLPAVQTGVRDRPSFCIGIMDNMGAGQGRCVDAHPA